jgi:lysozyme
MNLSAMGAADVRLHEGFVDHWYADPGGVGTIGTGFTWASAAFRKWWGINRSGQTFGPGSTITRAESDACLMLVSDTEYGQAVNKFLAGKAVAQNVFDASDSVCFNCGNGALAWKWAASMKAGDYKAAAAALLTTAVTQNGKKLAGLVARRKDEAALLVSGVYASMGRASMPSQAQVDAMSDGVLERGERGATVADLQKRLTLAGYKLGTPDGIFGYGTEAAVMAFQKASGLSVDGKAGPKTLAAIQAAA